MRLNWQQLNIFSVIVEAGGVAAAARELGISKSTIRRLKWSCFPAQIFGLAKVYPGC